MTKTSKKSGAPFIKYTIVGFFGLGLFAITALGGPLLLNVAAWALAIAVTGLSFASVRCIEHLTGHVAEEPAPAVRQVAHASGIVRK